MIRAADIMLGWIVGLFAPLGAVAVILVFALLVAAFGLLVFRVVSNQEGIRRGKAKMKAGMLGMLLFRHDLRRMLREMFGSLLVSLANVRFLVVPMLVMILPLWFVFEYLDLRLGYRAFQVGESAVVRVHLAQDTGLDDVALRSPAGVAVTSPGVRVVDRARSLREVDFRIRIDAPGEHVLTVEVGGEECPKRVCATEPLSLLPSREEEPSGFSRVDRIELAYESATWAFLGIEWAWWALLIVFMLPALFVLRRPFGVDF